VDDGARTHVDWREVEGVGVAHEARRRYLVVRRKASRDAPWYAKALGIFVVAYALSPIDLIPDFIPVLGYLDDMLLLPALIWLAVKLLPVEVLQSCRHQADEWMRMERGKPRSRIGMAFVIVVWTCACAATYAHGP